MIVAFATYLLLLSLLIGLAAMAAEPMLSRWGVKRRLEMRRVLRWKSSIDRSRLASPRAV